MAPKICRFYTRKSLVALFVPKIEKKKNDWAWSIPVVGFNATHTTCTTELLQTTQQWNLTHFVH